MSGSLILHCDKCNQFRAHRTVERAEYCNTCDTKHPDPFAFGELTPTERAFCRLLHDAWQRGILTEYPTGRTPLGA